MLYNQNISYNQPGINYIGSLIIKIASIPSPIVINNVKIVFGGDLDYSNLTTISVLSIEVQGDAVITVIPEYEDYTALLTAEVVYITGNTEISVSQ